MEGKGFDAFASEFFAPLYPAYAQKILERTGVNTGELLDLGCGGGHLGFALADLGNFSSVTFFDKQAKALEQARERAQALCYPQELCRYEEGDACNLSRFANDTFSLVASRGSMQFWDDCEAALREIHRVLKPNGCCYIGGGVGMTAHQTERLDAIMERRAAQYGVGHGGDPAVASAQRKHSRTEQCQRYAQLFDELDCSYALINSKSEGGWFIFRKDNGIASW